MHTAEQVSLPPRVEVKDVSLVMDIEFAGWRRYAASMQNPSILHHSRAAVHSERWQTAFAYHLLPLEVCQVQLPDLQCMMHTWALLSGYLVYCSWAIL